jgi:hypothetical protein
MIIQVAGSGTPPIPKPPPTRPGTWKASGTTLGPGTSRLPGGPPLGPGTPRSGEPPPPGPGPCTSSNTGVDLGARSGPHPPAMSLGAEPARPAKTATGNSACGPKTSGTAASDGDTEAELSDAEPGSPESELDLGSEPSFPTRPAVGSRPPAPERSNRPMSLSRSIRSPGVVAAPMPGTGRPRPWAPPTPSGARSATARTFPALARWSPSDSDSFKIPAISPLPTIACLAAEEWEELAWPLAALCATDGVVLTWTPKPAASAPTTTQRTAPSPKQARRALRRADRTASTPAQAGPDSRPSA